MFAYFFLQDQMESMAYEQFSDGIEQMKKEIELTDLSEEGLASVIHAVLNDNPGFFWFEGKAFVERKANLFVVKPKYLFDSEKRNLAVGQIQHIQSYFDAYRNKRDFEKAKAVYDWLQENVTYTSNCSGQNIYDALIEKKAVCKGLSKAYQFLLSGLNVFSTLVTGTLDGVARHTWNIVEIDGAYYNVDVSLGYCLFDFLFHDADRTNRYRTFLKSDAQFAGTHRLLNPNQPHLSCSNVLKEGL